MSYVPGGISEQPFPGVHIAPPAVPPSQGEVVIGYRIVDPTTGCCKCSTLNTTGLVSTILLAIFCLPCAWMPCCMKVCHQQVQVPVYGAPGSKVQGGGATAVNASTVTAAPQQQVA